MTDYNFAHCLEHDTYYTDTCPHCDDSLIDELVPILPRKTIKAKATIGKVNKPKPATKPDAPQGIYSDTYTYPKSGYTCYRILDSRIEGAGKDKVLFESSQPELRDTILERMLALHSESR